MVRFQMNVKDGSRSHCITGRDEAEKSNQAAKEDAKIDSEWHFEYLGTSEEHDGKVLRHFRIVWSSDYMRTLFGDNTAVKADDGVSADFWDYAETMRPHSFTHGRFITVFDFHKQQVSDGEVDDAVMVRTGKKVKQLLTCSEQEKATQFTPKMELLKDLSSQDANYYEHRTAKKSKGFATYLQATQNKMAMPDICLESCQSSVAALNAEIAEFGGDICRGNKLALVLKCLRDTAMAECQTSVFEQEHYRDCQDHVASQDHTASVKRNLEESEELEFENDSKLLVNQTKHMANVQQISEKRSLMGFFCRSKLGVPYYMGDGWCVKWKFEMTGSPIFFVLMFKWGSIGGSLGLQVMLQGCYDILFTFGLSNPFVAVEVCVGGGIKVKTPGGCPDVLITMEGYAFIEFGTHIELDEFLPWVGFRLTLQRVALDISAGKGERPAGCVFETVEGEARRRYWTRRRAKRTCHYQQPCDVWIKGVLSKTVKAFAQIALAFKYWVKEKLLTICIVVSVWFYKWWEVYEEELYRRSFGGTSTSGADIKVCGWEKHEDTHSAYQIEFVFDANGVYTGVVQKHTLGEAKERCQQEPACMAITCLDSSTTGCELRKTHKSKYTNNPDLTQNEFGRWVGVTTYTPNSDVCYEQCTWNKWENTVSNAMYDSENRNFADAVRKCIEVGSGVCKAITCTSGDTACTLRGTPSSSTSGDFYASTGATTYTLNSACYVQEDPPEYKASTSATTHVDQNTNNADLQTTDDSVTREIDCYEYYGGACEDDFDDDYAAGQQATPHSDQTLYNIAGEGSR